MDALDLYIHEGVGVEDGARDRVGVAGETVLVAALDLAQPGEDGRVGGEFLEGTQLVQVVHPTVTHQRGEQVGKLRIGDHVPAAGGDPVGLVVELPGGHLVEVGHELLLDEFGVQGGHTVDAVAADNGEIGHADLALGLLLDEGHASQAGLIAGPPAADLLEELAIDLVDDLQVAGQGDLEEVQGPAFEGLGQEGVVGVGDAFGGDAPGLLPLHADLVEQEAHQLGHGHGGVGVVELDGNAVGQAGVVALEVAHMAAEDVAQGAGDHEVFLQQAEFLPLADLVGGVEDLGEVLAEDLLFDRLDVVARVEDLHLELGGGPGGVETEGVDGLAVVAGDEHVERDADDSLVIDPAGAFAALAVGLEDDAAVDGDLAGALHALDLPG